MGQYASGVSNSFVTGYSLRLLPLIMSILASFAPMAQAENFSTGSGTAFKFGVHEIVLTGNGAVTNPFDTLVTVQFKPPSGLEHAKTVWAFYDGDNTWRARVYISETGSWQWESHCAADSQLDGKTGGFESVDSRLRGRLLIHPKNARQWMTEDGRWFLNLNDTSYFLLCTNDGLGAPVSETDFQNYVKDAVEHGITSFRSWPANGPKPFTSSPGGSDRHRWDDLFADTQYNRPHLEHLRVADRRLQWLLNHFPDAYMQFILFPLGKPYTADDSFWAELSSVNKERILRYFVARYAAYPSIFWLTTNDCLYTIAPEMQSYAEMQKSQAGRKFPNAEAMAREVGEFLQKHDPWKHPMSTGPARTVPFPFGREPWATYIHLEHRFDFGAKGYQAHEVFNKPVFLGEDRYEQDHPNVHDPVDMRYFQRRLFWSWLLSGGSTNYGGRWWAVHPYRQTGERRVPSPRFPDVTLGQLVGLDSVQFIRDFFATRKLELSDFAPQHNLIKDSAGAAGPRAPRLMRRLPHAKAQTDTEFLAYHPHASGDDRTAQAQANSVARLQIDLRDAQGSYVVEWYRVETGESKSGGEVTAGDWRELVAPWNGTDVVVSLRNIPSN